MDKRKPGSVFVEVIICSLLASAVILGGLELAAAARKIAASTLNQRERVSALSTLMNEIAARVLSGDVVDRSGWRVSFDIPEPAPGALESPAGVLITGKIRAASFDMAWKQWDIRGRR
jgi:hypothetical protein